MLELYHWEPNGSWLKPLIALYEKRLDFRSHYVDVLSLQQHAVGIVNASRETRLTQEGEGPLLVHDGKQITESLFMLEYLEDAFPQTALRPADALGQAQILAWARLINEVFMPAANTLGCHMYLAPQFKGRDVSSLESILERIPMSSLREGWRLALTDGYPPELLEDSRRKVGLATQRIEAALARSPWLVGQSYSIADIDAFAICNSLPTLTPGLVSSRETPHLLSWLERIRARPAVGAALAVSRTGKPEQAFAPGPEHARWG